MLNNEYINDIKILHNDFNLEKIISLNKENENINKNNIYDEKIKEFDS